MDQDILCVNYGQWEIKCHLRFSKRKSLEISVYPDKSVSVKAPTGTKLTTIESRIKKRARWIRKQIRYFEQFDPRTPDRKYVGGESHLYLGKQYRLKVHASDSDAVLLKNGYFLISTNDSQPQTIEQHLENWYKKKANIYFEKTFDESWNKFHRNGKEKPSLRIVKLKKRWGSLSKSGTLSLNLDLIKTPRECIEYVIIHELCHLFHHNHGPDFYKLLECSLPDWMKRKHRLEMALI